VDLVDDLLEVGPDQRLEQARDPDVEADGVELRLMIGRPLRHADERLVGAGRDVVEEVAVAEAAPVGPALLVHLLDRGRDTFDLGRREKAANDRISFPPVALDMVLEESLAGLQGTSGHVSASSSFPERLTRSN
jgi:hypothetical protein